MPELKANPFQGKTGRKPPYTIPYDYSSAGDESFTGTEQAGSPLNETRYRYSPDMGRQVMEESYHYHEPGESPAIVDFGSVNLEKGGSVYPDVIGLGEGEATPFSAQRGEMPKR